MFAINAWFSIFMPFVVVLCSLLVVFACCPFACTFVCFLICEFVCFCLLFACVCAFVCCLFPLLVWGFLFFVPFGVVVVFGSLRAFVLFAFDRCVRFWFCLLLFVCFLVCVFLRFFPLFLVFVRLSFAFV